MKLWSSLAFLGLVLHHSNPLPLFLIMAASLYACLCLYSNFPFFSLIKNTSHGILGSYKSGAFYYFEISIITCREHYFQTGHISEVLGGEFWMGPIQPTILYKWHLELPVISVEKTSTSVSCEEFAQNERNRLKLGDFEEAFLSAWEEHRRSEFHRKLL